MLAPFAFVSALVGALLVVEFLRREHGIATTNYWPVDTWGAPIVRIPSLRPRASDCDFCSKTHVLAAADEVWAAARAR